ncbi:flavodoxin family protein [Thalassotalea mangrovi]|uniref:NAD(P)H-dependent oxidoreductase n=1 Tax=Thalassotalea mangrovi TaxID=2572245 RepID=A0A4U1B422_9GAMM|nr:flavodoxin family protein [Thalassotalea mangrovi]TKB44887.1 NAD(P)H-dependent oxidoreductase [Thalassotalea mangrovi]
MKTAIILGSSRSHGNTSQLAHYAKQVINADYFDLRNYEISPFDYNNQYQDDFNQLISTLLQYEQLIFATPMYWYSASAQMKLFLDRLSDLLSFDKDKGRLLRGKQAALLATGSDIKPPECFEQVFKLSFNYLGINYKGMSYCSCPGDIDLDSHRDNINALMNKLG